MKLPVEFSELSKSEKVALLKCLVTKTFKKDECIFSEGEVGDFAMIIESGEVRLEYDNVDLDCESVVAVLKAGDIVGEMTLLDKECRSLSAYAESDVVCRMLSVKSLDKLRKDSPSVAASIYLMLGKSASSKLRSANDKMAESLVMSYGRMKEVDEMVRRAKKAQKDFVGYCEDDVDELLYLMCEPIIEHAVELAEDAVLETHMGNVDDKRAKHVNACLGIYNSLVSKKGFGVVKHNKVNGVVEIYDAMGVVFGMVPVTNPVSTTIFKAMIAVKSRNSIILSPNRVGSKVVVKVVDMLRGVLAKQGLPEDLIQVIRKRQSRQVTSAFMRHDGVALILATGGGAMVKAAYSSGTPAIGVGPGNTPCMVAGDANLLHAARSIVKSKSFDNGMICGSEHNLVVVEDVYGEFVLQMEKAGAAVLTDKEVKKFKSKAITSSGCFGRRVIGQDAAKIADYVGITRDYNIKLLVIPSRRLTANNPLVKEKTAPVLSLFVAKDDVEAMQMCSKILDIEGAGHTAVIHTASKKLAREFGIQMQASRVLVNSPAMQGIIGLCTGLSPSLTLGCGSFGGNSTTDNVSFDHLVNKKRLAYFLPYKKLDYVLDRMQNLSPMALRVIRKCGEFKKSVRL